MVHPNIEQFNFSDTHSFFNNNKFFYNIIAGHYYPLYLLIEAGNMKIDETEMEFIYTKDCSCIQEINLGKNKIDANALINFNQPKWSNLHSLYLWDNSIGDKGCKYLSRTSL